MDLRQGSRVLDVACGTGHVALDAARAFCDVTGIDYVPQRSWRSPADGPRQRISTWTSRWETPRRWPSRTVRSTLVLSGIGVMFTADHDRAAAELVRVCRPGGRIGLASWTPTGFVGQMLNTVGKHVPPPPAAQSPTRWGTEATVTELLGDGVHDVASYTASVTQRFPSTEAFVAFFVSRRRS